MRSTDVVTTALGNTVRSKARTILTVIAIFIGAFTLTLTSGLGVGINTYIDRLVQGFGDQQQLYVQKPTQQSNQPADAGPQEYDPEEASGAREGSFGMQMLSTSDIDTIRDIDGVESVEPVVAVSPTYLADEDGDQYIVSLGYSSDAGSFQYAAGEAPQSDAEEITIPTTWVESLGYDNANDAVGGTVTLGMTNATGDSQEFEATISGVTEIMLSNQGAQPTPSSALTDRLYEYQNEGLPEQAVESQGYAVAVAEVPNLDQQDSVKSALREEGLVGLTVEDQIGLLRGIINTVTWVLNGFALIALLAAAFGIVNTLLMSVQERTREIGLMKALGMSPGKIFGLFSSEAVLIGFIGSVIGVGVGVVAGTVANALLTGEGGALSNVAGLTLYGIAPLQLLGIILLIMLIAFIAGTLPAARAARKDPIDALRHE